MNTRYQYILLPTMCTRLEKCDCDCFAVTCFVCPSFVPDPNDTLPRTHVSRIPLRHSKQGSAGLGTPKKQGTGWSSRLGSLGRVKFMGEKQ